MLFLKVKLFNVNLCLKCLQKHFGKAIFSHNNFSFQKNS